MSRNKRPVLIFIGVTAMAQLPLLAFLVAAGVPVRVVATVFLLATLLIGKRLHYVPRPDPPPIWFERWPVGIYFCYATLGLFFTPGALVWWLLDLPLSAGWAWLGACFLLALRATGVPRRPMRVTRTDIAIDGLPPSFDGLTIAQLTDLHAGPYAGETRVRRWVERTNREQPDLIVLTGDLIASGQDWIPSLERALTDLRPRRAIYACMGNHDYFEHGGGAGLLAMHERLGHRVLRNQHVLLDDGDGPLVLAGVDDTWRELADLGEALRGVPDGAPVVLLAHDPEFFPRACERGVSLQISGHLHGGQLGLPFLGRAGAVLTLFRPFVQGLYRRGASQLYVSAGLGTTGAPIRVGMLSELTILSLRRP